MYNSVVVSVFMRFLIHVLAVCVIKHACVMYTAVYPQEISELITAPKAFNSYIRLASRTLCDCKSLAMPRLNKVNKKGEGEVRERYILPSLFLLLGPLDVFQHVLSRFLDIPSSPKKL